MNSRPRGCVYWEPFRYECEGFPGQTPGRWQEGMLKEEALLTEARNNIRSHVLSRLRQRMMTAPHGMREEDLPEEPGCLHRDISRLPNMRKISRNGRQKNAQSDGVFPQFRMRLNRIFPTRTWQYRYVWQSRLLENYEHGPGSDRALEHELACR